MIGGPGAGVEILQPLVKKQRDASEAGQGHAHADSNHGEHPTRRRKSHKGFGERPV
jgi:hypothetical protein